MARQTLIVHSRSRPTLPVPNRNKLILQVCSRTLLYIGAGWVMISSCLFFRGTGVEDPDQHFFICEVVWNIKQVQNDDIKRVQLTTTFRDRALRWFMNIFASAQ